MPPYFSAQVAAGMRLAAAAETETRARCEPRRFSEERAASQTGFDIAGSDSHIVPIVLGSNDGALAFASHLQARGYGIRRDSARPRFPAGTGSLARLADRETLSTDTLRFCWRSDSNSATEVAPGQAIPLSP